MAISVRRIEEKSAGPCEISRADAPAAFDAVARRNLGISGAEFLRKWRAKEFGDDPDAQPNVMRVAMLMDLAE